MISQIIWAAIVTILCVVITGCGQNEVQEPSASEQVNEAIQQVDEAREQLKEAKQELMEEKREENYADDKREFGNEIELRITKNEDRFADQRWELDRSERNYEEKDRSLKSLEQKNRDFKRRLNEYDFDQPRAQREEFKREIREDMNELEQEIRDVFKDHNL